MSRGGAMPSYTFTDPSSDVLAQSTNDLSMYNDNMTFKVLDIGQPPTTQGYESNSYDIVVASDILHASASLQQTLDNARQLLRPGGYLLLLELTEADPIRFTTIMGALPDWWVDVDNGRNHAATLAPGKWHSALRKAGFGGIDTITPKIDGSSSTWPFSVMAAQAVDEQVSFLRRPLASSRNHSPVSINSLVILGTDSLESARIAEEIVDDVGRFCDNITVLGGLPTEAEASTLSPMSTFVNLVDLDSPIFKTMTSDKMDGLRRIFELARHIFWVTCGAQSGEEPYHAASLAFCRSLSNEATHISLNALDISSVDKNVPRVIAEQLLRQCALEEWDAQQLLWSKEPETFLYDGKLLLPRIMPNLDQNARLNATRRVIDKTVQASTSNFSIVSESISSPPSLVEDVLPSSKADKDGHAAIVNVQYSSLLALRIADAFLYLAIGKVHAAETPVVILSTTNSRMTAPILQLPAANIGGEIDEDQILVAIMSELQAEFLIQTLPPGSSILVNCSIKDRILAKALTRRAAPNAVRVTFSCTAAEDGDVRDLDLSWIQLSNRAPRHILRKELLPVRPTHFLNLNSLPHSGIHQVSDIGSRIAQVLPSNCRVIDPLELCQSQAFLPLSLDRGALVNSLHNAISGVKTAMSDVSVQKEQAQDMILQPNQIQKQSAPYSTTDVVRWPPNEDVQVEVHPIDGQSLFSKEKTYILFGLSGQVGQSLCEWMVSQGAGCVCLTSRRSKVDQRWLESFRGTGATVKVLETDITDRDSLENTLKTIKATCPPIAGVANGANVLGDGPFSTMSIDTMLQTLGPKVDGSYNLDQAFYDDDLDFFVLFSSISCVIGTAGQANYVAANGYLNGLARQRRRRGLAASAFDMGLILGIGLAEAADPYVVDSLQKYGITPLSEPDLRLAFAESILAGYTNPEETQNRGAVPAAVMTSGLRNITVDEGDITWYDNPIFSHLVIDNKGADGEGDVSKIKAAVLPVKDQIAMATTNGEALQALKGKLINSYKKSNVSTNWTKIRLLLR